jgi:hypothetical protein
MASRRSCEFQVGATRKPVPNRRMSPFRPPAAGPKAMVVYEQSDPSEYGLQPLSRCCPLPGVLNDKRNRWAIRKANYFNPTNDSVGGCKAVSIDRRGFAQIDRARINFDGMLFGTGNANRHPRQSFQAGRCNGASAKRADFRKGLFRCAHRSLLLTAMLAPPSAVGQAASSSCNGVRLCNLKAAADDNNSGGVIRGL